MIFENSFKLHSPEGTRNFASMFKYHEQCKSLTQFCIMSQKRPANLTNRILYLISCQVFTAMQFTISHLKEHKITFQKKKKC